MATTNIELDIENITGVSDADDQFVISAQKFVVASVPKNLLKFAQQNKDTFIGSELKITLEKLTNLIKMNG